MARSAHVSLPDRGGADHLALPASIGTLAAATDVVLIVASGLLGRAIYGAVTGVWTSLGESLGVSLMLAFLFAMLMRSKGLYEASNLRILERQVRAASFAWVMSLGLIIGFAFLIKASADLSRGALTALAVTGLISLIGNRLAWPLALDRAVSHGLIRKRNAAVLSFAGSMAARGQIGSLQEAGIDVAARVVLPDGAASCAAAVDAFVEAARHDGIEEIIILVSAAELGRLDAVIERLRPLPLPIRVVPDDAISRIAVQPSRRAGQLALIDMVREPLSASELAAKRALDIFGATVGLLLTAPLLVLAMVAIKLDTRGPVLFRQTRRGFNGRTFKILKLRTMSVLEDGDGIVQASRADARVTRVGYWLRRTSIDELPQLWNVLGGEMSLVGPRPHAVAHDSYYDKIIEKYAFRHHVKPGLTGWAQVNGHRGATPEVAMMAARIDHDIWYVNNWSFLLDTRIVVLTAARLLSRSAY